jgi:uncharacterized protein YerC
MPKKGIDQEAQKLLYEILIAIEKAELADFLKSLMSSAEIKDLARRLLSAKLLKENYTFLEIGELMGMSPGTINKVYFKTKGSPVINKLFK